MFIFIFEEKSIKPHLIISPQAGIEPLSLPPNGSVLPYYTMVAMVEHMGFEPI